MKTINTKFIPILGVILIALLVIAAGGVLNSVLYNENTGLVYPSILNFNTTTHKNLVITNSFGQVSTNTSATTASIDWNGPSIFKYSPAATFTLSFVNTPSAGAPTKTILMELLTDQTGTFPSGIDWGGDFIPRATIGSTNYYTFFWNGVNIMGFNGQSSGVLDKTAASIIELDANYANDFVVTNRISAATTLVITNTVPGQTISIVLIGEASGGTSRIITLIPQLGHLIADLDTYGTALATSSSFTLTNGNGVEISYKIQKMNGTNTAGKVSRQFTF